MAEESTTENVNDASQPLTFTAEEAGSTVAMTATSDAPAVTLEYTTDSGQTWLPFVVGETVVTLAEIGNKVSIRAGAAGNERMSYSYTGDGSKLNTFTLTGRLSASGSIDSLLTQDPVAYAAGVQLSDGCYTRLFYNCTALKAAPVLPSTQLGIACYRAMFAGTEITVAPALPATTLVDYCYHGLFSNCSYLTQAPALPATTLAVSCYTSMFKGCTALEKAPMLPATTLAPSCYKAMFEGCTSPMELPERLPATTLVESCYDSMFKGCTAIERAPMLPADTLAYYCYREMFAGCSSLGYLCVGFTAWAEGVGATLNWVTGAPPSGEFHCRRGLPDIYDDSHIPGPDPASN